MFLLLLALPFFIIATYWNKFPAQVPMHWNFANEIDSYLPKEVGLFMIPGLNIVFYFLFLIIPRLDPRKENYKLFAGSYNVLRFAIHTMIMLLFFVIALVSLGVELNVGMVVIYLTLVLFLVIGNWLSTLRSNFFVGLRTPWTLENSEVWVKTHRLMARVWVVATLAVMALGIFVSLKVLTIIYFIYIFALVIVPVAYSFIIYKKLKKSGNNS